MTMDAASKLKNLGLSEKKVEETLKNVNLTQILIQISDKASKHGAINKNVGNLLYALGTKLPKQFNNQLIFLTEYIATQKINQEAKLTAAIKFIQDNSSQKLDINSFEIACGVGVQITDEQIKVAVAKVLKDNMSDVQTQRYRLNVGTLMGQLRQSLKWADSRKIKEEFDSQLSTLLGPKTEQDNAKPIKKKAEEKVEAKKDKPAKPEKATAVTMVELLRSVNFHTPGDNYKTDGYVIHEKTHQLLKEHLKTTKGQVRTRFPPEPNGVLHIGHAKAINVSFGYARAHDGICFLRFDDTNPEKEEERFFEGIKDVVQWLGYTPAAVTHSSDYFPQLFSWAVSLIAKGHAYVCHQSAEEVRGRDPPPSPWRERPVEESLKEFYRMRDGFYDEGEATLRLKLTLAEGKVDPVAYRVRYCAHARTGGKWAVYPTYDYTHCLCDSIEHITHSLCTKEFQSRRSSYYWLCNALEIYCPVQWEYGRLNLQHAVVSKRKIAQLIGAGHVNDWDDPRLFTLAGLRRRGFPSSAVNSFCASLGLTGALTAVHPDALDAAARDVLNAKAKRAMVVLEPLKVTLEDFKGVRRIVVPNVPGDESQGEHNVTLGQDIWIEKADFSQVDDKGYRRLTTTQPVGLRHAGIIIRVTKVHKNAHGSIDSLQASFEPVSETNKPRAFIHWVSQPIQCEVRLYEKLFLHPNPEDTAVVPGGFLTDVNPNSLTVVEALADEAVFGAKMRDNFQFERVGFFAVDENSTPDKMVFNRTVGLKEDKGKC